MDVYLATLRKVDVEVTLQLSFTYICGNFGSCLPNLSEAMEVIIANFVREIVSAGLPKGENYFFV